MLIQRLLPAVTVLLVIVAFFLLRAGAPEDDKTPNYRLETSIAEQPGSATEEVSGTEVAAQGPDPSVVIDDAEQPLPAQDFITLSGWIRNASGTGLPEIEIKAQNLGTDGEDIVVHRTLSNKRGEFALDGLVPGRLYRLKIEPTSEYAGYRNDSLILEDDAEPMEFVLKHIDLVDVSGMIVDTNRAPVPDFTFTVRNQSKQYPARTLSSDSSGYFRLDAFPAGELRIAAATPDYFRIKGLELKPDEYRILKLAIDIGNYHLSGWVSDASGAPLAGVQVTLKSEFVTDDYQSQSYRTRTTTLDGAFSFAQLGGQIHTLGVHANGYKSQIRDHEFQSFYDTLEIRLSR